MMNKMKILFSVSIVMDIRNIFLFLPFPPPSTWSPIEKKIRFYSRANLNFCLFYKIPQEFLNAYIPAQKNIHLFIRYTVAGQSQNQFFCVLCYWSRCCLYLACNTISVNAVQNKIWHWPHQQVFYFSVIKHPLVSY